MTKKSNKETSYDYDDIFDFALKDLNKKYGPVAYNLAKDFAPTEVKCWIPTGSHMLDLIISNRANGGWPVGKVCELSGEESTGKSFLADLALINTQKMGGLAILFDTESSRDIDWMKRMGMDLDKLLYFQPDYVEDLFEMLEGIITKLDSGNKDKIVTIVVDSIAGIKAKGEAAVEYGATPKIAEKARLISMAMRRITPMVAKMNVCLLFTNQLRTNIGVMFGDKWTTPGGKAIPFHSSVRVRLTNKGKEVDNASGTLSAVGVNAKVTKNRCAIPQRVIHFMIHFNEGIRDYEDWVDFLIDRKDLAKSGVSYIFSPNGSTEESVKYTKKKWYNIVRTDPKMRAEIKNLVDKAMILEYAPVEEVVEDEDESISSNNSK